jgi:hypothetical protein
VSGEIAGRSLERCTGATQRREDVELPLPEAVLSIHDREFSRQVAGEAMQTTDDALRAHIDVGSFSLPLGLDPGDVVVEFGHA